MEWERIAFIIAITMLMGAFFRRQAHKERFDADGWQIVSISTSHHVTLWLGTALLLFFLYIRLFVGSARADAAHQMMMLNILLVGFGVMLIYVIGVMHHIGASSLRWRNRHISYQHKGREVVRSFNEVHAVHRPWVGPARLVFADGKTLWLDPSANGTDMLLDEVEWASRQRS